MHSNHPLRIATVNTGMSFPKDVEDSAIIDVLINHMTKICDDLSEFSIYPQKFSFDASRVYLDSMTKVYIPVHIELEFVNPDNNNDGLNNYIKESSQSVNKSRAFFRIIPVQEYFEEYKPDNTTSNKIWEKIKRIITERKPPNFCFEWVNEQKRYEITIESKSHRLEEH